ncbi:MAG TPA: DUF3426 domain-containing protein [Woeseiaceae bacterium]|nr:DUF3426 domain-containing protein [Woeseiaceae bacterium]
MYTQCPHCHEVFRVTAEILQQAAGRVRCGACTHVFDALDGLSETPPEPGQSGAPRGPGADGIRIEDTGVEWRVVDDDADDAGDEESADASAMRWYVHDEDGEPPNDPRIPESAQSRAPASEAFDTPTAGEERYDDNTPLPGLLDDDDEEDESVLTFTDMPALSADEPPEPPPVDDPVSDIALGEPEDWTDLLAEVGGADAPAEAAPPPSVDSELELATAPDDEPTAEHPVIAELPDAPSFDDAERPGLSLQDDAEPLPADAAVPGSGEELTLVADEVADDELELVEDVAAEESPAFVPVEDTAGDAHIRLAEAPDAEETGEFESLAGPAAQQLPDDVDRLVEEELLRASGSRPALAPDADAGAATPLHVETIVMEGEVIRSSLHGELVARLEDEPPPPETPAAAPPLQEMRSLRDTYIRLREALPAGAREDAPRRWPGIAAALVLTLLLAAQLVHSQREALATWPFVGDTLRPLYARIGIPITPDWDVNAWQFDSTRGTTELEDRILTITSSITNRSGRPLPYPLLHVSLTDRYEEVVAGGMLEPAEYLAIRSAEGMIEGGASFTATFTIAPLPEQATGYKLNVCYPLAGREARCATGAFRRD